MYHLTEGVTAMKESFVITIGREFGSGGRETGEILAEKLGIKCYDKELLKEISEASGLQEQYIESMDEKSPGVFPMSSIVTASTAQVDFNSPSMKAYIAQFSTIQNIADRENCIIIGRCADYILSEKENVLNIFIYADMEKRIERVMRVYGLDAREAKKRIGREDKKRAQYYEYYTDKKWGARDSYDLCINTGTLGTEKTAELIANIVTGKF